MAFAQKHKGILPLLLLAPGLIWLIIFFAVPLYYQAKISLETGSVFNGFHFSWHFKTYTDAWSHYGTQFGRSFFYAGLSTFLSLLIGYPLAYADRKSTRLKLPPLLHLVMPSLSSACSALFNSRENDL